MSQPDRIPTALRDALLQAAIETVEQGDKHPLPLAESVARSAERKSGLKKRNKWWSVERKSETP